MRKNRKIGKWLGIALLVVGVAAGVYFGWMKDYQKERLMALGYTAEEVVLFREKMAPETLEKLEEFAHFAFAPEQIDDVIYLVEHDVHEPYTTELAALLQQEYFVLGRLERYLAYAAERGTREAGDSEMAETEAAGPEMAETEAAGSEMAGLSAEEIVRNVNCDLDREFYVDTQPTDQTQALPLINKYYYLAADDVPGDLVPIAAEYDNETGDLLDRTAYAAFVEMAEAAAREGLWIRNNSAYRSYETQAELYDFYAYSQGAEYAEAYSARPGFSEHQAGLALDLGVPTNMVVSAFEYTTEFAWLKEHAHEFGFILRYPEGKEYITGYHYEPWHYRYVGTEAATYIYEHDLTFEEYYAYFVAK